MGSPTTVPTHATVTASPVVSQGPEASSSALFDHSRFVWYQYKISSGMMGMPMIHTYKYDNVMYNGQPASHANITMDMLPHMLIYLDIWSKPYDNSTLKIHEVAYEMGNLTKDVDIDAGNYTKWEGEDLASPKFLAATLQASGTASVTIDNKTYTTIKYTGVAGDKQYTYWASQDVPVPVKFVVRDSKDDTIYELSGWGTDATVAPTTPVGTVSSTGMKMDDMENCDMKMDDMKS